MKIYILQNEIENVVDMICSKFKATDDERIIALQLTLNTAYKIKNARNAYISNVEKEKEDINNGNTNA